MSPPAGKIPRQTDLAPWYRLNQALCTATDLCTLFTQTMAFLEAACEAKNGLVALVDGDNGRLLVAEACGPILAKAKGRSCSFDEGGLGKVMKGNTPLLIADIFQEPLLKGIGEGAALVCISAPLRWSCADLGVLVVDTANPPAKDAITLVGAVAAFISPPLMLMRWMDEASLDGILMTKLKRAIERMDLHTESQGSLMADIIRLVERTLIETALKKADNVQLTAARFLGINRNTLHKKIKELGINREH